MNSFLIYIEEYLFLSKTLSSKIMVLLSNKNKPDQIISQCPLKNLVILANYLSPFHVIYLLIGYLVHNLFNKVF